MLITSFSLLLLLHDGLKSFYLVLSIFLGIGIDFEIPVS